MRKFWTDRFGSLVGRRVIPGFGGRGRQLANPGRQPVYFLAMEAFGLAPEGSDFLGLASDDSVLIPNGSNGGEHAGHDEGFLGGGHEQIGGERGGGSGDRNCDGRGEPGRGGFDGMSRNLGRQGSGCCSNPPPAKEFPEPIKGATHAFLRCIFRRSNGLAHIAQAFVFQKARHDRISVGFVKRSDGFI